MTTPKMKRTVVKTDKKWFAVTCDTDLNLKQIMEQLDTSFITIEAYRLVAGPVNERYWRSPDGTNMGRLSVRYNNNCRIIEVASHGQRGLIHAGFPKWVEEAKKKYIALGNKTTIKEVIKKEKVEELVEVGKCNDILVEIDRYMKTLKDTSEIGALWKFGQYISNKNRR